MVVVTCAFFLVCTIAFAADARADQNQFSNNGDGTIYDAKTGLTWQMEGFNGPFTWSEALAYVESLNSGSGLGGCRGWVLPTRKELKRLVDHGKSFAGPALINTDFFPNTAADFYWSSSSHKNTLKYAISFANGQQRKMSSSNYYHVRAMRGDCDPADNDGDGYLPSAGDCNDNDPNINPDAVEMCDGVDNNCDGYNDLTCWDVDNDGDGQTENQGDCDDRDPYNYTGNFEVCDGADNDCDAVADNGLTFDADADGYTSIGSCGGSADDCDDSEAGVNPDAVEICGDLIDQNCDGADLSCLDVDNDGDGYTENQNDCDDNDIAVHPGAAEVTCDGMDNDCSAATPDAPDGDGDGVALCSDCDDADPANFPGNTEVCDGADNDCDSVADNGLVFTAYYQDGDGDAFGNTAVSQSTCNGAPAGYVADNTDCDDSSAAVNPGAVEATCDGLDNDCSAATPDAPDNDGDGVALCSDCDDADPANFPGNNEVCDGADNDCDTTIDEGATITFYYDLDGDFYGTSQVSTEACSAPANYVADNTDCNDNDFDIHPGAEEICGDGIDQDCLDGDAVCSAGVQLGSNGNSYDFIQDAYAAAATVGGSDTIKMQMVEFGESLIFDQDVTVTLAGGYDESFTEPSSGWSIIASSGPALVISNGTVLIEYVVLR
jgi:hypothetical protein